MRLKILFLVVLTAVISSQYSFAALNAYLYLEGEDQGWIKGSTTIFGREDLITVIAYSHIISSPRDPNSCQPTGRRNHLPLTITKDIDKSTPLLLKAFANHERMKRFKLYFYQIAAGGTEEQHYTVELDNAYIAGIHQEMLNNRAPENATHKEREHISFTYDRVTRTWVDPPITAYDDWQSDCGRYVLTSDLNFDGAVNLLDLSILAYEWLEGLY